MAGLTGTHLVVILVIVLLLFGAPKLPALARSLGQSARILKQEVATKDDAPAEDASTDETKPKA